jgi:pimeloyl-ACP methyl ester carboxylesterase
MGEFIVAVADAFGLEHPHVVAPSIGTAAALFAAARHPGRLRSLVVGSGATAVPLQVGGLVKDIIDAPDLERFRRADPRQLARFMRRSLLLEAPSWNVSPARGRTR